MRLERVDGVMRLQSQFALPKRDAGGARMPDWARRRVGTVLVHGVHQLLYVTTVGLRLARVGKNGQAVTVRVVKNCKFTVGALAGLRGQSLLQGEDSSWLVGVHTGRRVIRKLKGTGHRDLTPVPVPTPARNEVHPVGSAHVAVTAHCARTSAAQE